jgi:hypothetical protein
LVAGYGLSKILSFPTRQYDVIEITIPPPFVNQSVLIASSFTNGTNSSSSLSSIINPYLALNYFNALLSGPLPIPPFDFYVVVAKLISDNINSREVNLINTISGEIYGNLIQFGALHLSPYPSPLVDSYIEYMNKTSLTFKKVQVFKHTSESVAVQYIENHLDVRAWALIVFRDITSTTINYVIRQNYTTLPDTNTVTVTTVAGLNTLYQDYYLSGFLTLQNTVDHWAFLYTNTTGSSNSPICDVFPNMFDIPFPTVAYSQNQFYPQVGPLLGLALTSNYFNSKLIINSHSSL